MVYYGIFIYAYTSSAIWKHSYIRGSAMKATWELVPIPYIPYSFWLNLNDLNAIAVILHLTPLIQWIGLREKK